MKINRVWAMPNKETFKIKPIKELLNKYVKGIWADPFANNNSPAKYTNDLNPTMNTMYHLDAIEFLKLFKNNELDGVLYDPPYSPRQVSECYKKFGYKVTMQTTQSSYWRKHKDIIAKIIKPGGYCISFGWNSSGIGKKRGFSLLEILLVSHGGYHNDTIVTVEEKTKGGEIDGQ